VQQVPVFRKDDRYKRTSYRTFNVKLPERYDSMLWHAVFHHFYRPADALGEIHRVLRPNGRIIIVDPWFVPVVRQVLNAYLYVFQHDGDCRFYSQGELIRLLAAKGFPTILENRGISRCSYLVVGQKRKAKA
jgi:SAM-dependent methyltransferase